MATYSTYKNLEKPLSTEKYNVGVANKNVDIIDSELHKLDLKNESQDNLLATKESLNSEISRATAKENAIIQDLDSEISRAQSSENEIISSLMDEINRAITSETVLNENLSALITELTTRLNTLADSDDTTLDQLSEIVAYIKNNKDLIDGITTAKVDKVSGKGLSANDYTTAEKDKLSGIASGAEVNVQADWNITDTTNDAFIKNKPTIPTKTSQLINDSGYKTSDDNNNYVSTNNSKAKIIFGLSEFSSKKLADIYNSIPTPGILYHSTSNESDDIFINNPDLKDIIENNGVSLCGLFKIEKIDYSRSHIVYTAGLSGGTMPNTLLIGINGKGVINEKNVIQIISQSKMVYSDSEPTSISSGMTWIGK